MSKTRKCSRCRAPKPLDAEHFARSGAGKFKYYCRPCDRADQTERRAAGAAVSLEALEGLKPWASDLEREALDALLAHKSTAAAAEALGLTSRRLRGMMGELERRAAAKGWAPGADMTKPQPDGFRVKGVSTLYRGDGSIAGQWVKTARDQNRLEDLMDAVQGIAEPFRGLAAPAPCAPTHDTDLLAVYPMGDPHLGMFAWGRETGNDFDLVIAERNLVSAVDHLVDLAPAAEHALVINLGDFFHADSSANVTMRSHHALDVDTRWPKMLEVGIRTMRRIIDRSLEKHAHVTVICEIGNHDDHSAIMLALCLSNYYEREPRVTIDTSPAKFHFYRFGACLLGVTHGDTVKKEQLPGIMACDRAQEWGETLHRKWYTGHVHHDSLREYAGCTVESFRTLAARDAWHHGAGYRSERDMKVDIWHKTRGLETRHIVGIRQLGT